MPRNRKLTFGIIGVGRFGSGAATELLRHGHEVLLVDRDPSCLEPFASRCETAIGNAEDIHFLEEAGMKEVDAVIIAIGDDETSSNHATMNCKDLGLYVVAKALHATHGKILERLGADRVVFPERESGMRMARLLTRSAILDMIELYEEVFMMEITAKGELTDRTLAKLNLTHRFGVQVVMIIRSKNTIFPVSANDTIYEGDILVLVGRHESLTKVVRLTE
ncbi:potassium channel family protein [Alicyclobacillus fastidiosus]|uniref:TrkA family potassium uptake protein n=1 Tax=Alicyclobacillus fastidiosus TaxID=392011 RepID=A0ABV5AHS1_9BACL|nr:TrkA family potassium uptake protein [Alicyclobacillus fastidiosus]WEH09219.1 TrkA family potassium uptake protein [Alicyclobacillus fastidiosus]